jgi:hypothetical protein
MSAQGLNSASYNGFYFAGTTGTAGGYAGLTFGAGIPVGFPTRDASDYTKLKKQTALYREYQGTSVTTGSQLPYNNSFIDPVDYTIVQSNQNRLSSQFGLIPCSGCTGPFPTQYNLGNLGPG